MEALDLQLARILTVIDKLGGVALITADHGNADEMYEIDKKTGQPKRGQGTAASRPRRATRSIPLPCIIYDNFTADRYTVKEDKGELHSPMSPLLPLTCSDMRRPRCGMIRS